ncbi:MAG: hypothetical protein ABI175_06100 [Polyangiales bacterium]
MSRLRAPFVLTLAALSACSPSSDGGAPAADASGDASLDTSIEDVAEDDRRGAEDGAADAFDGDAAPIDPNPAGCPRDDPGFGPFHQRCTLADTVRCTYRDECPLRPSGVDAGPPVNVYTCHDDGSGSHWTLVSPGYLPDCPATEPTAGSACPCSPHMQYIVCLYGSCEELTSRFANCEGPEELERSWRVTPTNCNPPEPDGGLDASPGD